MSISGQLDENLLKIIEAQVGKDIVVNDVMEEMALYGDQWREGFP